MKTGMSRRGVCNGGRWHARARWRKDSRLLILDYVDVWFSDGSFLGRFHEHAALSDARALDRKAQQLVSRALPGLSGRLQNLPSTHAANGDEAHASAA